MPTAKRIRVDGLRSELPAVLPNEATSTIDLIGFESLPALDFATDGTFAVALIDPDAEDGDVEIAYVEAHALDSATVTLRRGREGSQIREHAEGIKVVIGPTAADLGVDVQRVYDDPDFDNSFAIGGGKIQSGPSYDSGAAAVAIGPGSVSASYSVALGSGAMAIDDETVALGQSAQASVAGDVAIGIGADADQQTGPYQPATAVGSVASATGIYSTALGASADAYGPESTALGSGANAAEDAIAIGRLASAGHVGSVVIGRAASDEINGITLGWRDHTVLMQGGLRLFPLYRDGDYAIDTTNRDLLVIANAGAADSTITLPTDPAYGRIVIVKRRDEVNANVLTVVPQATGSIDGSPDIVLAPMESVWMTYVGTGQWFII